MVDIDQILANLTSPLTVSPNHKWLQIPDDALSTYNSWDTVATAQLQRALTDELRDNGQLEFFRQWFDSLTPGVIRMQRRGIGHLDRKALTKYRDQLRLELNEVEGSVLSHVEMFAKLRDEAAEWFSKELAEHPTRKASLTKRVHSKLRKIGEREVKFLNDTDDLSYFLYGGCRHPESDEKMGRVGKPHLGLKPAPKTQKRAEWSVAQEALIYVLNHFRKRDEPYRELVHNLFHRSRLDTIMRRYLKLNTRSDGRVCPQIKLYGAESLRWAYADPPLHQWPKEIRHLIIPAEGCVFLSADWSQLEARISANFFGDLNELSAFDAGLDIHEQNAWEMFDFSPDDWLALTEQSRVEHRDYSKHRRYEFGYGASLLNEESKKVYCPCPRCVDKVPAILNLSRQQIREAGERWAKLHPWTVQGREELARKVRDNHNRLELPEFNYVRFFFEPWPGVRNQIYNFPMQFCLHYKTQIATPDGYKPIIDFAKGRYRGPVLSVDPATGKVVESGVTAVHKSDLGNRSWVKVTHDSQFGDRKRPKGAIVTNDHQFLTEEGNWIPADQLDGQKIQVGRYNFGPKAMQVARGTILGDGSFNKNSLSLSHCKKQKEWIALKSRILGQDKVSEVIRSDKSYDPGGIYFRSRVPACESIVKLQSEFIRDGRKHVPINLELTEQMLATWFLDDGYLHRNPSEGYGHPGHANRKPRPSGGLCTDSFTESEVRYLVQQLHKLGVTSYACKHRESYRIRFSREGFSYLCYGISRFVPQSMRYKLSIESRLQPFDPSQWEHEGYFTETAIARILEPPNIVLAHKSSYCLTVEPWGNFITTGGIAHNCAAQIINRAFAELDRRGAPLVLQLHDELMLECPIDQVDRWSGEMREVMEAPVPELGGAVFPIRLKQGRSWGELN